MLYRVLLLSLALVAAGCATTPKQALKACPQAGLQSWPVPASCLTSTTTMEHVSKLVHRQSFLGPGETLHICNKGAIYSPEEGVLVLEARWHAFFSSAQPGDTIWQYRVPMDADEMAVNPNLSRRGFVLVRGCRVVRQLSIEDIASKEQSGAAKGAR